MKKGLILGLTGVAFVAAACSADPLSIPNPNSPTVAGASADPGALQLQATGITRQLRGGLGAYITATARFGREGYIYTPNEGRNTSHYLIGLSGQNRLDPTGFAVGVWGGNYGNLRDIFNFKNVVNGSTTLSATQQSAALGFARTIEALELLYVIAGRDSLGAVVQINQNASDLAPFVSRDSVYRYILGTLDGADTDLGAGGAAFPFVLHSGFAGFNTPTTFRQFNRAIRARASVYFATRGGGNALYTQALTALAASFLNGAAANAAAMDAGIYHVYSTATGDATNGVGQNADYLTHPSFATDIAVGDLRASKWTVLATARNAPQSLGIATNLAMNRYAANNTRVPVIRNEELILLRAEARWFTNDKANAIADLNTVRSVSGGLGASTVTVGSTDAQFIDALLYERRFSLLSEGHRWVDHRRFDRLGDLPRDITTGNNAHFVARVMPIPQGECLVRARANDPALAGPGC
ncbi:MAG: RagB/SusD family nutrient uptake outer membrane protein [Gemmatimonadetes bacterium]|nr:RagB/SusD family nutrient uptake outer membrane protein [Gemmatimonadota bacterium]MBP7550159.1 RagB/SusD family nutrient uptake outer membrane protein [Gemmatimonadaceae bacterium]